MTRPEVARLLEDLAEKVIRLPGVSRTRPHAFVEAKSELRGEILAKAKELLATSPPIEPTPFVAAIRPGVRSIGRREVQVVRRARRA